MWQERSLRQSMPRKEFQTLSSKSASQTRHGHGRVRGKLSSTVPSMPNQSLRTSKPSKRTSGTRTTSRQKDSNGHNTIRKNSKHRNKGLV